MMKGRLVAGTPLSRFCALALLLLALFVMWEGLGQPILDLLTGDGALSRARHAAEELDRVAARLPGLTEEKAALLASPAGADAGFVPGTDPRLAAAALAGRLNSDIKASGGELLSSEALELKDEEDVKRVGLRLRLSLPQGDLPDLLYRLEYSQPTLFIQSLAIAADKEERLTITLDLHGYLGSNRSEAAATSADLPPGSFGDIVTRPLFARSRHRAALRTANLSASSLRLAGLVVEDGRPIALVRPDSGREVKIGPGALLNGWRVADIDSRWMDLAKDGRRVRVTLKQPIPPAD